jgi:hypothetical protein
MQIKARPSACPSDETGHNGPLWPGGGPVHQVADTMKAGPCFKGDQGGRSEHWIKVKNRKHPAMQRVMDSFG